MRLLHMIFKHQSKMHTKKARHLGSHRPEHQGPKPHHTGHTKAEAPTTAPSKPSKFDKRSGQWGK